MPVGLALITTKENFTGDGVKKGFLDSSYPKEFNISRGLIHKIVKIIDNADDGTEGILEIKYSDKIILVHERKYSDLQESEVLVIILASDEVPKVQHFYDLLEEKLPDFYRQTKNDRILTFQDFAKDFFQEKSSKKLLIIGFPSAGKTCIKKAFFDNVDPSSLLDNQAPEPTRGLAHYVYSWLDAEVGIVDSSGQEFESYVSPNNDFERMIAFQESDSIIYVFDVVNWQENRDEVIDNLEKIIISKNTMTPNAKIFAFCHKIDLLEGSNQEKANQFLEIKDQLSTKFGIKTVFTSIKPALIHTLFRSMQIILNDMSQLGNSIEDFCAEVVMNQNKTAIFLMNEQNNVISQKSSEDMKLDDISKVITLVKNQQEILTNLADFGDLDYSIVRTKSDMAIVVKQVNILKYGVSVITLISKSMNTKTLTTILDNLDKKLNFERTKAIALSQEQ